MKQLKRKAVRDKNPKIGSELSQKEQIKELVVEDIAEFLAKYEGIAITPTVAMEMADKVDDLVEEFYREYDVSHTWLVSFINLLMWGFSGAIVLKEEQAKGGN